MSSLTRIATIEISNKSTTGLIGYLTAVEKFVNDVKVHSGQDVTGERQGSDKFYIFCPSDQNFERAENSARMLESFVRPHIVRFMGEETLPAMQ